MKGMNGLRALAAFAILIFHADLGFYLFGSRRNESWLGPYLVHFDVAVPIFFVLSGFLLYRPYARAHQGGAPPAKTRQYYLRRALRILPAYWVVLTVLIATGRVELGWPEAFWHYTLLHVYSYEALAKGLPQIWSIAVEVMFYLLLPLLAWAMGRRAGGRDPNAQLRHELAWVGGLAAFSLAFRLAAPYLWTPHVVLGVLGVDAVVPITKYWLPSWLEIFAAGMGLAAVDAWCRATGRTPALLKARWFPLSSVAIAAGAFWYVCNWVVVPESLDWHNLVGPSIVRQSLYGVVAVALVAPIAIGRSERPEPVRAVLGLPSLELLGIVSYGIFLVHASVLAEFDDAPWADVFMDHLSTAIVLGAVVSTAVGALLYVGVERPAQLLARRWGARGTMPAWATPIDTKHAANGSDPPEPAMSGTTGPID